MNKLLILAFLTFCTLSLEAYSKKVILAAYSTEKSAQNKITSFFNTNPSTVSFSKEHNFQFKVRKSGKHHVLVAEAFYNEKVLYNFLKKIKKSFPDAYINEYTQSIKKVEKAKQDTVKTISKKYLLSPGRKVILGAYSSEKKAQGEINNFSSTNPSLVSFSKENNINFKVRQSGKYHILVAEAFYDKRILYTFLKKIRKNFQGAYIKEYTKSIKKVEKTKQVNKIKKNIQVKKVEQTNPVKTIPKKDLLSPARKVILAAYSSKERAQNKITDFFNTYPSVISFSKEHDFQFKVRQSGKYYVLVAEVFYSERALYNFLNKTKKTFPGAYINDYIQSTNKVENIKQETAEPILKKDLVSVEKKVSKIEKADFIKPIAEVVSTEDSVSVENKIEKADFIKPTAVVMPKEDSISVDNTKSKIENKPDSMKPIVEVMPKEEISEDKYTPVLSFMETVKEYFEWSYLLMFVLFLAFIYYYLKFKRIYDEY